MMLNQLNQLSDNFVHALFDLIRDVPLGELAEVTIQEKAPRPTAPKPRVAASSSQPQVSKKNDATMATLKGEGNRFFLTASDGRVWQSTRRRVLAAKAVRMGFTLS